MSDGTKLYMDIDKDELPKFFRDLADALEKGGTDEFDCLDDFKKLKVRAEAAYGQVRLKMKIKTEQECRSNFDEEREPGAPEKPAYKQLKKRMKISFRMLVKMIHDGQIPPQEAVDSFLEDSALMITYPGYGDEFYSRYAEVCDAFRQAYESGDLERMHEAVDALVHEKGHCHAKYA